jgi:hypothetical protein
VAITLHAIAMLPAIAVGLFLMWRDGVRPAEVRTLAHVKGPLAPRNPAPAKSAGQGMAP